jgi:hypothetical protein
VDPELQDAAAEAVKGQVEALLRKFLAVDPVPTADGKDGGDVVRDGTPRAGNPVALWRPREASGLLSKSPGSLLSRKKISKKFRGIWTSFGTDFLKNQKQAENSNWHWALG